MPKKYRKTRAVVKSVCLVVEGCTEKNYFTFLAQKLRKHLRGALALRVEDAGGGSPKTVVSRACKLRKIRNYDLIFVIFDIDRPQQEVKEALSRAQKCKVDCYMAKPCFERWLLAHFSQYLPSSKRCEDFLKQLSQHVPGYKKGECKDIQEKLSEHFGCHLLQARLSVETFDRLLDQLIPYS